MKMASLETLLRDLRSNYKSQWDEDRNKFALGVLMRLREEVGLERTGQAVYAMIAKENFFEESVLQKYIPEAVVVRKTCDACRSDHGWLYYVKEGFEKDRWYVYAKKCKHDCQCLTCGDTGWVCKPGHPGSDPKHYDACECKSGDKFRPSPASVDRKSLAVGGE